MAGVGSMKIERCKFSHKIVWRTPYLNVRAVRGGNVPVRIGQNVGVYERVWPLTFRPARI